MNISMSMDWKRSKHLNTEIRKVLEKLSEIESHGKYDQTNCEAVLDAWNIFSCVLPETFPKFKQTFKRLVKLVSRTILSGLWGKLQQTAKDRLKADVTKVHSYLKECTNVTLDEEIKQCEAISALLITNPWSVKIVQDVLHPSKALSVETSMYKLWETEGWDFLESRIEALSGLGPVSLPLVTNLTEACVVHGRNRLLSPSNNLENPTSFYDLTEERHVGFLALWAVLLKSDSKPQNVFDKLRPFMSATSVIKVTGYFFGCEKSERLIPHSDVWKNCEQLRFEILEEELKDPDNSRTEIEINTFYHLWLSLSCQLSVREENESLNEFQLHSHPMIQIVNENDIENMLPKKFKDVYASVSNHVFAFKYADWMVQFFGLNIITLAKCMELYISRLSPYVSRLLQIRDQDDMATETLELSQILFNAFQSISIYFSNQPQLNFELLLTTFSLNPTREGLDQLRNLVTSTNSGVNITTKLGRTQNATIGLPQDLYHDLINIIQGARIHRLTCFRQSWEKFEQICIKHLETRGSDIKRDNELDLARPENYSQYAGLKPAYDEDDHGYEVGYYPQVSDLVDSDEETSPLGKSKLKIREPASRMKSYYNRRRVKEQAPVISKIKKRKYGPRKPRVLLEKSSLPKTLDEPTKDKENFVVQRVKRKYVRTAPYVPRTISSKKKIEPSSLKNESGNSFIPERINGTGVENMPIVKLENQIQPEEQSDHSLPSSPKKRRMDSEYPRTELPFPRRRPTIDPPTPASLLQRWKRQKGYKAADCTMITVLQNYKIYNGVGLSGTWPPVTSIYTQDHQGFYPKLPSFPVEDTLPTTNPYHESSPMYHVARSPLLGNADCSLLINRFSLVCQYLWNPPDNENSNALKHCYKTEPYRWITYFGVVSDNEVSLTPIDKAEVSRGTLNEEDSGEDGVDIFPVNAPNCSSEALAPSIPETSETISDIFQPYLTDVIASNLETHTMTSTSCATIAGTSTTNPIISTCASDIAVHDSHPVAIAEPVDLILGTTFPHEDTKTVLPASNFRPSSLNIETHANETPAHVPIRKIFKLSPITEVQLPIPISDCSVDICVSDSIGENPHPIKDQLSPSNTQACTTHLVLNDSSNISTPPILPQLPLAKNLEEILEVGKINQTDNNVSEFPSVLTFTSDSGMQNPALVLELPNVLTYNSGSPMHDTVPISGLPNIGTYTSIPHSQIQGFVLEMSDSGTNNGVSPTKQHTPILEIPNIGTYSSIQSIENSAPLLELSCLGSSNSVSAMQGSLEIISLSDIAVPVPHFENPNSVSVGIPYLEPMVTAEVSASITENVVSEYFKPNEEVPATDARNRESSVTEQSDSSLLQSSTGEAFNSPPLLLSRIPPGIENFGPPPVVVNLMPIPEVRDTFPCQSGENVFLPQSVEIVRPTPHIVNLMSIPDVENLAPASDVQNPSPTLNVKILRSTPDVEKLISIPSVEYHGSKSNVGNFGSIPSVEKIGSTLDIVIIGPASDVENVRIPIVKSMKATKASPSVIRKLALVESDNSPCSVKRIQTPNTTTCALPTKNIVPNNAYDKHNSAAASVKKLSSIPATNNPTCPTQLSQNNKFIGCIKIRPKEISGVTFSFKEPSKKALIPKNISLKQATSYPAVKIDSASSKPILKHPEFSKFLQLTNLMKTESILSDFPPPVTPKKIRSTRKSYDGDNGIPTIDLSSDDEDESVDFILPSSPPSPPTGEVIHVTDPVPFSHIQESLVDEEVSLVDEEVSLVDEEVSLVDEEVSLVDEIVSLVDEEVSLVDEVVSLVDEEVSLVNEEVSLVDEEESLVDEEESLVDEEESLADEEESSDSPSSESESSDELETDPLGDQLSTEQEAEPPTLQRWDEMENFNSVILIKDEKEDTEKMPKIPCYAHSRKEFVSNGNFDEVSNTRRPNTRSNTKKLNESNSRKPGSQRKCQRK